MEAYLPANKARSALGWKGTGVSDILTIGAAVRDRLVSMLDEFESDENLTGLCAIASIAMAKSLHRHGYKPFIVEGLYGDQFHCWNSVNQKFVDITATQFDPSSPQVFVFSHSKHHTPLRRWDSICQAEDETWVSEVAIDWRRLIVTPFFQAPNPNHDDTR